MTAHRHTLTTRRNTVVDTSTIIMLQQYVDNDRVTSGWDILGSMVILGIVHSVGNIQLPEAWLYIPCVPLDSGRDSTLG